MFQWNSYIKKNHKLISNTNFYTNRKIHRDYDELLIKNQFVQSIVRAVDSSSQTLSPMKGEAIPKASDRRTGFFHLFQKIWHKQSRFLRRRNPNVFFAHEFRSDQPQLDSIDRSIDRLDFTFTTSISRLVLTPLDSGGGRSWRN